MLLLSSVHVGTPHTSVDRFDASHRVGVMHRSSVIGVNTASLLRNYTSFLKPSFPCVSSVVNPKLIIEEPNN